MTDLYDLFTGDDDSARMQAEALTSALRRKQAVGQLALLTGDKVLGRFGEAMLGDAGQQQGMVAQAGSQRSGQRLQGALQAKQQGFSASEAEKERGFRASEAARGRAAEANALRLTLGAKEKERAAAAEAAGAKRVADTEEGLRKELMGNPSTRHYLEATVAYDKVRRAAADPSAAGDLALIFGYMKTLDPASSVREGEFANAQNAGGVDSRVASIYNRVLSGERLSEAQRADFVKSAGTQYAAQKAQYEALARGYQGLAEKSGVAPDRVALPMGLETTAPAPRAAAPAAASDMVQVQKPDGQVVAVPKANLKRALELGGKVVSDGG